MLRITHRVIAMFIALGIAFGFVATPSVSHAAPVPGLPCQTDLLPSNDPVHPYQITLLCVPSPWNGNLVVYAHGYVDPSLPLSLPAELNLLLPDGSPNPASLPAVLLNQGFAVATTSYSKNGYAVEQGGQDLNALVSYAKQSVLPATISRVYLIGASEGALISTMLLERNPKIYNGALSLCGAVGGWAYQTQYAGDFVNVFNYFFPGVAATAAAAGDVNAQAAIIGAAFQARPDLTAQLFSVTGAAIDQSDPATAAATAVATTLQVLFYSNPAVQFDLQATAGGNPYSNLHTRYRGSFNDKALNAGIARIAADRPAQRYVSRFYTPSGEIKRPIVSLHNALDPVVPFRVEQLFAQRVQEESRPSLLTSIPTRHAYGHCNFDPDEILTAFGVLVAQVQ
jgi:pimeloyl-ACP methyl ester carboxylesterase